MKIITRCGICETDFMYDPNHLEDTCFIDPNRPELLAEYSIRDAVWPSRRYNAAGDYVDLSGHHPVCQDCTAKRRASADVNVDGHVLCAIRGCVADSNESTKYCDDHYHEIYPDAPKGDE